MVYHSKLVVCVKVGGKVLRESDDTVSIPFGSEYSILIKNLNTVRVQCKVSVDGKDATEGMWLVVPPNKDVELERFVRNGNMEAGNRFKFVARTKEVEEHRGLGAEDGLVRVEWKTEKATEVREVEVVERIRRYYDDWYWWPPYVPPCPRPHWPPNTPWYGTNATPPEMYKSSVSQSSTGVRGSSLGGVVRSAGLKPPSTRAMASFSAQEASFDDSGITVPGSESRQQFEAAGWFPLREGSESVVLRLRGVVGGKAVAKAVTVKDKTACSTCGKSSRSDKRFCAHCGTALVVV